MTPGLLELVDLVMKHRQYVTGSVAGLQLRCEGMSKKVSLCLFLVRFDGSDEDGAEIGGRGG